MSSPAEMTRRPGYIAILLLILGYPGVGGLVGNPGLLLSPAGEVQHREQAGTVTPTGSQ